MKTTYYFTYSGFPTHTKWESIFIQKFIKKWKKHTSKNVHINIDNSM